MYSNRTFRLPPVRRKTDQQCIYNISVDDWSVSISFNDYAYINLFDSEEFEEHICMILEGRIAPTTTSKKCKNNMDSKLIIRHSDLWYEKEKLMVK